MTISGSVVDALQLVGVAFGLIGQVLISQKKRSAFVIWGISNIAIFALNAVAGLYLMAGLFAVYFGFCVYSFRQWGASEPIKDILPLGTKTLLFGVHQFLLHPLLIAIAWVKLYHSLPSFKELVCIVVHDWGYWGKPNLKNEDGDRHPELGAAVAEKLFGPEWRDFVLGHSYFYVRKNGIKPSKLLAADKYWHCMVPLWFYKLLAVPSGEFAHYRAMQNERKMGDFSYTDEQWWRELQKVALRKAEGTYQP